MTGGSLSPVSRCPVTVREARGQSPEREARARGREELRESARGEVSNGVGDLLSTDSLVFTL